MAGVSLGDIAKDLNLSRMTVSMIMNNKAEKWRISDATKKKVLARAKELGYRRNANARSMITGQTKVIGYLEQNISHEPSARTLHGLVTAAGTGGYSVKPFVYCNGGGFEDVLHRLMEYRPDALVYRMCSHENLTTLQQECMNFNIPLLVHGSAYPMEWGLRVNTNDVEGAKLATRHLLELGHRNIYHIGMPNQGIEYADSRYKGFVNEMTVHGISNFGKKLIALTNSLGIGLEDKLLEILKLSDRPTAFFCASDYFAMRAIRVIRQLGLKIPEDISIVGFADLDMARYSDPPLTTIAEPFEEVGKVIFRMLQQELKNKIQTSMKTEISEVVRETLVFRKSTGKVYSKSQSSHRKVKI